ncbi:MAG: methionine synthase [Acidobacteria bacterium]|nr:methionine synthase [Acidobacteriota bacterium]
MNNRSDRVKLLKELLDSRILLLDGGMGTQIHARGVTIEDYGGPQFENCTENLLFTKPEIIKDIHRAYFAAGSDIVETNSFGGASVTLAEFGIEDKVEEVNHLAAQLARLAADEFSTSDRPRFVAGSMGPTTKSLNTTGGITFDELAESYRAQALALAEGGVDVFLLETALDTGNIKAGLVGIDQACEQLGYKLPVMVSGTINDNGTMLAGQAADALVTSLQHVDLLSIGLNCATGPEFMTDHIRSIHELSTTRVSCYPNAGLPDSDTGQFGETPESLSKSLERFVRNGWLNIVGGCCGTTPEHIRQIGEMIEGRAPRRASGVRRTFYTGTDLIEATEDNRPLLVGERTNEVGSRKFKRLITEERFDEAAEVGRAQVKNGAHIIDINLENPDRDELDDIAKFYPKITRASKAPLMIDSTSPESVELALKLSQGKSIVNSINFEDGEERFEKIVPLLKRFGAAVVIGSIDEDPVQAQAITRERKLAIAKRSRDFLVDKWQFPEEDIIFDPLVFPCGTGDENYSGSAVETIEAVRAIKRELPLCKTVLGVSNVSFGLPGAAREVINSVFLYHATKAGLDLAIVNTQGLERYAQIPDNERRLAEGLLWNTPPEGVDAPQDYREQPPEQRAEFNQHHIAAITEHFRVNKKVKKVAADLPLDERLANYIIEGTKEGLIADLDLKRAEAAPLDIVNGPLMVGMAEVGRLFNNNELIVAEVLQSAESMKAAVSHLEQFMEKEEGSNKGALLLATVKGDVHDIGKNLVDIILTNNGYRVINLGIKVTPETLVQAFRKHKPDAIGLSGLLVKSAQQMIVTGSDLKDAGVNVPLLVGGAALSDSFTRKRIAPAYGSVTCYANDAMTGLSLMNRLMDPAELIKLTTERETAPVETPVAVEEVVEESTVRSTRASLDVPPLPPPYPNRIVRNVPQLEEVWSYINPAMLYTHHLGFKGNFEKALASRDPKALSLFDSIEAVKQEAKDLLKVRAVWQFFEATAVGNGITLFEAGADKPVAAFTFPRQKREDGLCLSDYVMPAANDARDSVAMFVVTAGQGVREKAEEYKTAGEYLKMHALQALALETAEACSEWLHRRLREDWGSPDPADLSMKDRLKSEYRGRRYSPGYAACPDLDDQAQIFAALKPEEIGVELTEGSMMEPEASVSAFVFHHPDCIYFDVTK